MKKNRTLIFLMIVSTFLFLFTLHGAPGNFNNEKNLGEGVSNPAFESPHERSSYMLLLSLVYNKSVSLTTPLADFGANDVGVHDGKLYSLFPPGTVVSIMPLYLLGTLVGNGQLFAYATVILVALATIFLIFRISEKVFKLPEWGAASTAFIFAFGTTAWSYSITIYQHIFTTFLILAGFYAVFLFRKEKKYKWVAIAGVVYVVSIFFDYTNLVLLFPILVYLFLSLEKPKRFLSVLILFVACLLPAVYNEAVFGDWKTMSNPLPVYKVASPEELNTADVVHHAFERFHPDAFFHGLNVLLFSYDSGMFIFSPILLIGFLYILQLVLRRRKELYLEHIFLISIILINILLYSFFDDPAGGMSYGPRYMIPSMACLAFFVGLWLAKKKGWNMRIKMLITFILFAFSSFVAVLGSVVTNMVPYTDSVYTSPIPHAMKYCFYWLFQARTGSFVYNTLLSHLLPLPTFFALIYFLTLIFFIFVLLFDFETRV